MKQTGKRLFGETQSLLNAMSGADGVGKWNMIIPFGQRFRKDMPGGSIDLTPDLLGRMVANFEKRKERSKDPEHWGLPITRFHQDERDGGTPSTEKMACGWITALRLGDDGLYALEKFNQDATADIKGDKLRFQSPEFSLDFPDSFTGEMQGPTLFGSALLNDPFFYDMPRVAAGEHDMADTNKNLREKLCAEYGLNAEASDDSIIGEVKKHKASHAKLAKMEEDVSAAEPAAGGTDADGDNDGDAKKAASELAEKFKASEQLRTEMSDRIKALEAERATEKLNAMADELMGQGKIKAADREKTIKAAEKLGIEVVREHYKSLPPLVEMGERGVRGEPTIGGQSETEAKTKLYALVDELREKDKRLSFSEALKRARKSLPAETKLLFSVKANSSSAPAQDAE